MGETMIKAIKLDKTQFYGKIADNSLLPNLSLYCAVRMHT